MLKNIYFESTMFEIKHFEYVIFTVLLVAKLLKSLFRLYSLLMKEN